MAKHTISSGSGIKFLKPVKKLTKTERLIIIRQQQQAQE